MHDGDDGCKGGCCLRLGDDGHPLKLRRARVPPLLMPPPAAADLPLLPAGSPTQMAVLAVFAIVYLGMFLGGLPRLKLDRTGVAVLGAIAMIAITGMPMEEAARAVDLPTIVLLFIGLFVVNHALARTGLAGQAVAALAAQGVQLQHSTTLLLASALLSNLVSNVPAVMLLLPHIPGPGAEGAHTAGALLALASTFAGNLLLVGSIANMIVTDLAAKAGVHISWQQHLRTALPVTLMSLAVLGLWLG